MRTLLQTPLALLAFVLIVVMPQARAEGEIRGNEQVASVIEQFITSGHANLSNEVDKKRLFQIFTFYHDRDFKPIWSRDSGPKTKAKVLLNALKAAREHGLDPGKYAIPDLEMRFNSTNPEELAEFDLLMSDVFADFGRDLSQGQVIPSNLDDTHIQPHGPGPLNLIDGAEAASHMGPYLDSLAPQTPQYARLKDKLATYRAIAAMGGWPRIAPGPTIKPGMSDARIPALRRMLAITGDYPGNPDAPSDSYDPDLVAAVQSFQARHGLAVDGVVGPATHAALDVPVEARIRQMEINMERRRWMPDDLGERYVFVNIADAFLKVVEDRGDREKTILGARLVVGKPYTRTPVFSHEMSYVEINPSWGVPASIANNEFLPKLKENPGALLAQNIRMFADQTEVDPWSVDWASVDRMPYQLRQDPGPTNALGRIKFMFPNKHAIYIHDTPSKSLFERDSRFFSHGCMRVQDPQRLAEVLLGDQGWSIERIRAQIDSGERRVVSLETKIPVHITYLTAWVNKDGTVHFRNDVYDRDKRLAAAVFGDT
ncbi:MAG: L,D-transpeptidase family protein [Hyphomicrobiales bacterium]